MGKFAMLDAVMRKIAKLLLEFTFLQKENNMTIGDYLRKPTGLPEDFSGAFIVQIFEHEGHYGKSKTFGPRLNPHDLLNEIYENHRPLLYLEIKRKSIIKYPYYGNAIILFAAYEEDNNE